MFVTRAQHDPSQTSGGREPAVIISTTHGTVQNKPPELEEVGRADAEERRSAVHSLDSVHDEIESRKWRYHIRLIRIEGQLQAPREKCSSHDTCDSGRYDYMAAVSFVSRTRTRIAIELHRGS